MKKYLFLSFLQSLFLLIFLLGHNIITFTFDINSYAPLSSDPNILLKTGLHSPFLLSIYQSLTLYLRTGNNQILNPTFSSKEILHMQDVYNLYFYLSVFLIILFVGLAFLFILSLYFIFFKNKFFSSSLRVLEKKYAANCYSIIFLLIFAFIGYLVFSNLDFTSVFIKFHQLFFSNDLWMLDPSKDLLIQMLPEQFFENTFLKIGQRTLLYFFIYFIYNLLTLIILKLYPRKIKLR